MSQEQKIAWLMVGAFVAGLVLFAVLIPFIGARRATAGFGAVGLAGLGPLIFRKRRSADVVSTDERDKAIAQRATLAGGMMSYLAFCLACMISFSLYRFHGQEVVSVYILPRIVGIGGGVFFLARSITIIGLYGREGRHGKD